MSKGVSGRTVLNAGLASSLAALTAACSQSSDRPPRSLAGDGSRASINRPIFSESEYGVSSSPRVVAGAGRPVRKGGGTFKLGSPYKVAGRWYVPREEPNYDRTGVASWYGDDFHGRATANGEIFDRTALTAAHPTLPLPSYAYVTNLANNRTVLVRINDRGPYVNDRMIDLSHASARALGYESAGRARVRVRYAGRAPLNGDDRRERQFLASQPWSRGSGQAVASAAPADAPMDVPQRFPAGTAGRWSPTAYRSMLAGKPVPQEQTFAAAPSAARDVSRSDLNWVASPRPPAPRELRRTERDPDMPYNHATRLDGTTGGGRFETSSTSDWDRAGVGGPSQDRAYVQVGTFRERSNAERMRRELGSLGPVEVAPYTGPNGEVYKVRIGPMARADARATVNEVAARGVSGSTIVSE